MSPRTIPGPTWRAHIAIVVCAVVGSARLSSVSLADDTASKAAAKARLERGADLLVTHGYTAALLEFEDAYRLFPSPKIFFDIGLANVGLNRNPEALRAFQRFLGEATDASPETVTRAKAQIETLRLRVAIVDVVCPTAGTEILIDDRSMGRTPLPDPVYLDPGQHALTARTHETGAAFSTTFAARAGERTTVLVPAAGGTVGPPIAPAPTLAVPPAVATSSPDAAPALIESRSSTDSGAPPLYRRPWFWAAAAGVVVAASLTLWLTVGRSSSYPSSTLGQVTF